MQNKRAIYGDQKCDDDSGSDNEEKGGQQRKAAHEEVWKKARCDEVKMIDFGGATEVNEHHTEIINTRQYRAPEVILSNLINVCYVSRLPRLGHEE